jgi:hypothetical protein
VPRHLAIAALSLVLAACQAQTATPAPPTAAGVAPEALASATAGALPPALASPAASPMQPASIAPDPTETPSLGPSPTFTNRRVATRIVIRALGIDLPVMFQTAKYGTYPLCDVAMYLKGFGQPGRDRATYIYAHARAGMFLPLLTSSQVNDGKGMIGDIVEVYTGDSFVFKYRIAAVHRHTLNLDDAFAARTEEVFLQTSEGPRGTIPKLQVIGTFISAVETDWESAHPVAHPRRCG